MSCSFCLCDQQCYATLQGMEQKPLMAQMFVTLISRMNTALLAVSNFGF